MNFFKTSEPYIIADKITSDSELSPDLVAHVFLMMSTRKDIENPSGFFARVAYQQWNWSNSEFNKLYRPNNMVRFNEEICIDESDVIQDDKFKAHFRDYFTRQLDSVEEWYCREIAYLWVYEDMTYREIAKEVKTNVRYVTEAIKQFKYDVYNSFYSGCNSADTNNF